MPGGRPTKYTPEFLTIAKDYLDKFNSKYEDQIPSIAGLAVVSNISRETLRVWGTEEGKEEFSAILAKILAKQESILINKGLSGEFNSNITKLALGKHGYHEKHDVGGQSDNPVAVVEADAKEYARRLVFSLERAKRTSDAS